MSFSSYSLTPSANVTLGTTSVAEGCPAGNINDAVRQLAADGKELANTVAAINVSSYLPLNGGTMTGNILQQGGGGHFFHADPNHSIGQIWFLPTGSALPTPQPGAVVFFVS